MSDPKMMTDETLREVRQMVETLLKTNDGPAWRVMAALLARIDALTAEVKRVEAQRDEHFAEILRAREIISGLRARAEKAEKERDEARIDRDYCAKRCDRAEMGLARTEQDLARLREAAGNVVKWARELDSYDWGARLDDSKTSDDAKHDARELGYAVYEYDRALSAALGTGDAGAESIAVTLAHPVHDDRCCGGACSREVQDAGDAALEKLMKTLPGTGEGTR